MYLSEELMAWVFDLGVEVRVGKSKRDLKALGLHLCNPTLSDLVSCCYEMAIGNGCVKVITIYLWEIT